MTHDPNGYRIDLAQPDDVAALPAIEREAADRFRGWDVLEAAFADVTSLEDFHRAQVQGLLWVARAAAGAPVGFAHVELLGEPPEPHLEEIDVLPSHGRRGLGRRLVEAVLDWARSRGYRAVTLTTFRHIPWNAPFYASMGFQELPPAAYTPALQSLVCDEAARGLEPHRRLVMIRRIDV